MFRPVDKILLITSMLGAGWSCAGFAFDTLVVIDRIEAGIHSDVSSSESADLIGIPTGIEFDQSDLATKLQETKLALEASGKFSDVELRLGKSTRPQHFVLTTDIKRSNDHYFGVGGELGFSPYQEDWGCACTDAEKMQSRKIRLNAYTGSRNYNDTGWAFDLDLTGVAAAGSYSNSAENSGYHYKIDQDNKYIWGSLTGTAVQQDLLDGHAYAGAILSIGTVRILSNSTYDSIYNGSDTKTSTHADHSNTQNQIRAESGLVVGIRARNFTLGARFSRELTQYTNVKDNEDSSRYVDGKLQADNTQYFRYLTDDRPTYRNEFVLSLEYSEKPKLNLVEYGLDAFIAWQHFYRSNQGELPNIYTHGEYTWKITPQYAFTYLADGLWRRTDITYINASLQRIFQMGGRLDFIDTSGTVFYGQYYRSGVKRNEITPYFSDVDQSGYLFKNRGEIGVQYASPEFLYSFSFIYGAEPISEIVEMNRKQFERLGVH